MLRQLRGLNFVALIAASRLPEAEQLSGSPINPLREIPRRPTSTIRQFVRQRNDGLACMDGPTPSRKLACQLQLQSFNHTRQQTSIRRSSLSDGCTDDDNRKTERRTDGQTEGRTDRRTERQKKRTMLATTPLRVGGTSPRNSLSADA